MTTPGLQPVYLAVPSHGVIGPDGRVSASPAIPAFVDHLAQHPATAEGVLVAVVEFSGFVNERCALETPLKQAAQASISGFDGISYASLFEGLSQLLDYDRHRLSEDGIHVGRPLIALIVDSAPDPDDQWRHAHQLLIRPGDDALTITPPVIAVVSTTPEAMGIAELITFPGQRPALATDAGRAGELAAAMVLRARARRWGIGEQHSPHQRLSTKGSQR